LKTQITGACRAGNRGDGRTSGGKIMDASTLADHYRQLIDPESDPLPAERAHALRFKRNISA
jgi:hypothetical protein